VSDGSYTNDIETLRTWIGRSETRTEPVSVERCNELHQTLDRPGVLAAGDVLPPLWHFISHHPTAMLSELDRDGHPKRGGFLPPVLLPRRMWAGGRITFHDNVHLGEPLTRHSTIENIEQKDGRSGLLVFVTVRHDLLVDGELRITESQDLVYRDDPAPDAPRPQPKPAPDDADFARTITPSAPLLFRYSALTFNSHRIHYDREYARSVEGYPNLVVHGPLTATLLAGLAEAESGRRLTDFSFRGLAPLFDDAPFTISGRVDEDQIELWAATPDGGHAMQASATLTA